MKKIISIACLCTCLLAMMVPFSIAQIKDKEHSKGIDDFTVTFHVIDSQTSEDIIGATILNLRTYAGTVTNINGMGTLFGQNYDSFQIAAVGYGTIVVTPHSPILTVKLVPDTE